MPIIESPSDETQAGFLFWQPGDLHAGSDVLLPEPALIHLQCKSSRFFRAVRIQRLRLHVLYVDDATFFIKKGNR